MSAARVVAVAPGSPAASAGFAPGDEIQAVNGAALRDVIEYRLATDGAHVDFDVVRGGLELTVVVEKEHGVPVGIELEHAVFDQIRTCDNHCPFCFIYQLPPGMRPSLSLKDDDYRLSFLYGNFTTLTRFTEADLERVVDERLGPLYVSIHATDPHVRSALLRNRRGATSLRWLELLLDAGTEVHGQVVVCPGVNDGDVLDTTLRGVLERFPQLATVGVVPLGVSDYSHEPTMRPHTPGEARVVVDTVHEWQARFLDVLGRRLVFAADEYYLLAGQPFPAAADYEGFAQHENGIGMARMLATEVVGALAGTPSSGRMPHSGFFAWVDGAEQAASVGPSAGDGRYREVDGAPADGFRAPRGPGIRSVRPAVVEDHGTTVLTGELGAPVVGPLVERIAADRRVDADVVAVANRFFGGNIGVTGLLTGADVRDAAGRIPSRRRLVLPDVVLSRGKFLDGATVDDLGRPVEVVATNGRALVDALTP